MASNRNSLLTGGRFVGIIGIFSFYIFIYSEIKDAEYNLEQDWS